MAFAPRVVSSSKSRDVGAIVGGVVGGVAGVIGLGLLGFYCIRRSQDKSFFKRAAALEEEHKVASAVEPFTLGSSSGHGHHPSLPGTPYSPGFAVSPLGSPQAGALLFDRDAGPLPHLPPSYEEASENGSSSVGAGPVPRHAASGYPFEKGGYRRDTAVTTMSSLPPSPNNQSTFGGSSSNGV